MNVGDKVVPRFEVGTVVNVEDDKITVRYDNDNCDELKYQRSELALALPDPVINGQESTTEQLLAQAYEQLLADHKRREVLLAALYDKVKDNHYRRMAEIEEEMDDE
jgi:hypothetical protein